MQPPVLEAALPVVTWLVEDCVSRSARHGRWNVGEELVLCRYCMIEISGCGLRAAKPTLKQSIPFHFAVRRGGGCLVADYCTVTTLY
jgi:hypothetical protein